MDLDKNAGEAENCAGAGTSALDLDEQLPPAASGRYASLGNPVRAKTWDELTPDERIERLRDALRSKDFAIQELQRQLYALSVHRHGDNGELFVPFHSSLGVASCGPYTHDPLA